MRQWFKVALVGAVLGTCTLASCFLPGPVGTNKSTTAYPSPSGGKISLTYTPVNPQAAKVAFSIDGHDEVSIPTDDSPDDGFTAVIDVTKLPAGIYTVNATEDDASNVSGTMTLLVPGAGGDTGASGGADTGGSTAASPAPAGDKGASATTDTGASSSGATGAASAGT